MYHLHDIGGSVARPLSRVVAEIRDNLAGRCCISASPLIPKQSLLFQPPSSCYLHFKHPQVGRLNSIFSRLARDREGGKQGREKCQNRGRGREVLRGERASQSGTRTGLYFGKRFCEQFSESSPCLPVQQGSCCTTVEFSENILQNLLPK